VSRRGLAWLLGALLCSQAAFGALSKEAFTREYVTVLRAALPDHKIEIIAPLHVKLTDPEGGSSTAFLDNAYTQYESDPDARQDIIEQHVAARVEAEAEPEPLNPANIVPVIKDRGWLEQVKRSVAESGGKKPFDQVVEDLNESLVIVYAEDTPRNIRYFSGEDLAKAGVERARLRALAVTNLRRVLPEIELHDSPVVSMLTAGGTYEASLLLLDDLWGGKDKLKVEGDYVVAVPSRDVLLVTGSRNQEGLAKLRELAEEIATTGSYTLTRELFVYRQGRFVRFAPE
jgi:uncharacterized protein YtpQ (UPF0354 family)